MGVYHLMGLGLSPGAVTGSLSYLASLYQRWNDDDKNFFSRSGEVKQRKQGDKVGDVQSIILFTTREVIKGKDEATGKNFHSFNYIENPAGRIAEAPIHQGGLMKDVLKGLLEKEWSKISGGRNNVSIYWVEVERRDMKLTYERIIKVILALAGVGGQGKEMWVNLTGGNNVTNFALQLAATLSGEVARIYYVQAENQSAEKCIRYTSETNYWVDLPVMPLVLSELNLAVLAILEELSAISSEDLYSLLHQKHWHLMQGILKEIFDQTCLTPMWKQGLIAEAANGYIVGSQWKIIKPYQQVLQEAKTALKTLEQLAKENSWIEKQDIQLK